MEDDEFGGLGFGGADVDSEFDFYGVAKGMFPDFEEEFECFGKREFIIVDDGAEVDDDCAVVVESRVELVVLWEVG